MGAGCALATGLGWGHWAWGWQAQRAASRRIAARLLECVWGQGVRWLLAWAGGPICSVYVCGGLGPGDRVRSGPCML